MRIITLTSVAITSLLIYWIGIRPQQIIASCQKEQDALRSGLIKNAQEKSDAAKAEVALNAEADDAAIKAGVPGARLTKFKRGKELQAEADALYAAASDNEALKNEYYACLRRNGISGK